MVGEIQDQKDQTDDDRTDQEYGVPGTHFRLELTCPLEEDSRWERNGSRHSVTRLLDEFNDIAVVHVEVDIVPKEAVFALNRCGPLGDVNVGDFRKRDVCSIVRVSAEW